jgi:IS30 family transposase
MRLSAQDKFRRRVKTYLASNDLTVTGLAKTIGRRRDTVSTEINSGPRFPRVRALIEAHLPQ